MIRNNAKKTEEIGLKFLVALAFLIIFSSQVFAISGSSGGITASSTLGQIGYTSSTLGDINYGSGGSLPIGIFDSLTMNGGFGDLNITHSLDIIAPNVTLISPLNNTGVDSTTITFTYNVSDDSTLNNCILFIDNTQEMMSVAPSVGVNNFVLTNVNISTHNWKVECQDANNNNGTSITNRFSVIDITGFSSNISTNLSNVNIAAVPNFTLAKENIGQIKFNGLTDLSNGVNINQYITIGHNIIQVDSASLPLLNKPATLTMYGVEYSNIIIWKNGAICSDCSINSFNSGILSFDVQGFSTYTVTGTTALNIYDDTTLGVKYPYDNITFTANYTNITSGAPIAGNCNISFNLGTWTSQSAMNFDGQVYSYVRNFSNVSTYDYNISCYTGLPGFDSLSLINTFIISGSSGLSKINISILNSSRYNIINDANTLDTNSGNITNLIINMSSTTKSWQGYYGNISSNIGLMDNNGTSFYDWSGLGITGKIYATRGNNIGWSNIECTNSIGIDNEDTYLEKIISDRDTVAKTFNDTTHPSFSVLNKQLSNCNSRKLNGPNGPDNNFWNILISDNNGDGNLIYTGLVRADSTGFTGEIYDFELIVGAKNNQVIPYYFYMELG